MPCFSVSVGASLPRTFQPNVWCRHFTCILLHGRISKIRPRHDIRNDAGYNYNRGQSVPIGYARPASGGKKGPCITRHDPLGCLPCLTAPRVRTKVYAYVRRYLTRHSYFTSSHVKRDTAIRLSRPYFTVRRCRGNRQALLSALSWSQRNISGCRPNATRTLR